MNTHPAIEFLKQLAPLDEATYNIEHYTDLPKGMAKPKSDRLGGRYANLTLQAFEALLPKLESLNDQGAGIFVARNQCSGRRNEKTYLVFAVFMRTWMMSLPLNLLLLGQYLNLPSLWKVA